jgi:hypothetical protein
MLCFEAYFCSAGRKCGSSAIAAVARWCTKFPLCSSWTGCVLAHADTLEYNILYGKPEAQPTPMDPAKPPKTRKTASEVSADVLDAAQVRPTVSALPLID